MEKNILILANSRKPGGRCVAGKDSKGNWIRLVKQAGAAIPTNEAKYLEILNKYNVNCVINVPSYANPHHIENNLYQGITSNGILKTENDLRFYLDNPSYIYGGTSRKVIFDDAQEIGYSLLLVEVFNLSIYKISTDRGQRLRCNFLYNSIQYIDFSVTDINYEQNFKEKQYGYTENYDRAFLTISLGENFKGYCYKLVANIITIR